MNRKEKITREILIEWIDRPPSNEDLDIINYIIKLHKEKQQLKKQKDDVVEYIKTRDLFDRNYDNKKAKNDLLRMLGEKK